MCCVLAMTCKRVYCAFNTTRTAPPPCRNTAVQVSLPHACPPRQTQHHTHRAMHATLVTPAASHCTVLHTRWCSGGGGASLWHWLIMALHTHHTHSAAAVWANSAAFTAPLPQKTTPSRRTHCHWHHWHHHPPHPMSPLRHHAVLAPSSGGPCPTVPLAVTLMHCRRVEHAVAPQGEASDATPDSRPPDCRHCHCHCHCHD